MFPNHGRRALARRNDMIQVEHLIKWYGQTHAEALNAILLG